MRKLLQRSCSAEILPLRSLSLTQFSRPSVDLGLRPHPPSELNPSPHMAEAEDKGGVEGVGDQLPYLLPKLWPYLLLLVGYPAPRPSLRTTVSWANSCHTA